ncbi:hypothetical protein [Wolbachia endosymbiont of Ctenocephalides felis wCfeT]|uniref:hypothetical protein n=1 Tax=Wolbachia endosymbiont of Ctenocephalides felis wCfeT TaxID=2732593 RepID=UPI00144803AD|nr:hypothetical protein [Wolbachia endosymbiont of Ctenocephalides felis wCfeT]
MDLFSDSDTYKDTTVTFEAQLDRCNLTADYDSGGKGLSMDLKDKTGLGGSISYANHMLKFFSPDKNYEVSLGTMEFDEKSNTVRIGFQAALLHRSLDRRQCIINS